MRSAKIFLVARVSRAARRGTPKGAKSLHLETVDLIVIVLITTRLLKMKRKPMLWKIKWRCWKKW